MTEIKNLFKLAEKTRKNAYSPYSKIKVGAALRTRKGEVFSGCNVENSSYGATICAERVAIQSAVATIGHFEIAEIVVVTDANPPWPPCGMCRQVIAEFAKPSTVIHAMNPDGAIVSQKFSELFPNAFTPEHLLKSTVKKKKV